MSHDLNSLKFFEQYIAVDTLLELRSDDFLYKIQKQARQAARTVALPIMRGSLSSVAAHNRRDGQTEWAGYEGVRFLHIAAGSR